MPIRAFLLRRQARRNELRQNEEALEIIVLYPRAIWLKKRMILIMSRVSVHCVLRSLVRGECDDQRRFADMGGQICDFTVLVKHFQTLFFMGFNRR